MLRRILLSVLALVGLAAPGRADLVIYLQDTTVPQGGTGVLNIWLGSTNPAADVFNNYSIQLQITGPNLLEFAPNPVSPSTSTPGTQTYSYLAAANYVFAGDSLFGSNDSNAGALPAGQNNQQFIAFDQSLSLANHGPSGNTPGVTLLASLVLSAVSTNPGETYQVSVLQGANTFFNQVDANLSVIPGTDLVTTMGTATGYNGTMLITGAQVPEPTALVSAGIGVALLAIGSWKHLRSRA
jgi:hypothetical protein